MNYAQDLTQLDGKWYNNNGEQICGAPTDHGPCRNRKYCRFHASFKPEQLRIKHQQKGSWLPDEHSRIIEGILQFGVGHWVEVSNYVQTRTPEQCQVHYYKWKERTGLDNNDFLDLIKKDNNASIEVSESKPETAQSKTKTVKSGTPQISPQKQEPHQEECNFQLWPLNITSSTDIFQLSPFSADE